MEGYNIKNKMISSAIVGSFIFLISGFDMSSMKIDHPSIHSKVGIIDSIEQSNVAVEIKGEINHLPIKMFPQKISVGDVVEIIGDRVTILEEETKRIRNEIEDLMKSVWEK